VAGPDRQRNNHARPEILFNCRSLVLERAVTSAQLKTTTTLVRIAVAKLESTLATPTLARTAVGAANKADSSAQNNQFVVYLIGGRF